MNGPDNLEILEPLGADQGTFVARDTATGSPHLVVVERVTRASPVPAARAELLRRGRALKALEHPKVVRVRDVFERDAEVLVVSDYVDGEWLSSLMMMQPRPPLGVMLRVVIDVLEGLGALHGLRDEREQPLGFVHGALGPDTVLVAADGVAEIARSCRLPRPGANERYVAPELRRGDGPADVGSDVYAAGAILRDIVADAPSDATWAEPLTDIAWRACAVDPETRWPSALAMATTVRRIAGSRLATAAAVAEFMRRRFGEKMLGRRAALEALDEPGAPSSEPVSLKPSDLELLDPSSAPTLVASLPALVPTLQPPPVQPTPPMPPAPLVPREVPVARVALVKKPALILEPQELHEPPELPEAATKRRPTTHPAPAISVTPPPPQAQPQKSLPPPTIVPEAAAPPMLEAYRRQMPTFPTFEGAVPPRRRAALQAVYVAGAIVMTFVLGWWLGRTYGPPEAAQAICPSATTLAAVKAISPPTATATSIPTASAEVVAPAAVSSSPVASASAPPAVASSAPTAVPTTSALAMATPTPHPTAAPTVAPTVVVPKPAPNAAPKPSATHGGFVPEEL